MNVFFLTNQLSPTDGWSRYSYEIIQHNPTHVHCRQVGSRSRAIIWAIWDFFCLKRKMRKFSAVHALVEPLLPLGLFLSSANRPLIATIHGTYGLVLSKGRLGWIYRLALKRAKKIITASHYTKNRLISCYPELSSKIEVIPLGGDLAKNFDEIPERVKREKIFLMVGEVKARKGILEAVRAFALVSASDSQCQLIIVGKLSVEAYVAQVKAEILRLGLEEKVHLLGQVTDHELTELYRKSLCLLAPSQNVGEHFEGFGIIHLEANGQGLPSIGGLDCGNEEAISPGQSGFLVAQGDIPALKETMLKILSPQFNWDWHSSCAYQWAKLHSWESCAQKHRHLYHILGANGT